MNPESIFSLCGLLAMAGWLLLVVAPSWRWTQALICTVMIPGIIGLVYGALFISQLPVMPEGGGFGSLAEVQILFTNPYLLLGGWIHYLAFDLFVGAWEVRDAQRLGINHWLVVPCLLFTFMLGPLGLVLYFVLRAITARRLLLNDENSVEAATA